jgi:hypothetical protein
VNHPPIAKKTYTEKAANPVPNFAARWRSIRKYFIQSKESNQEKQCEVQKQNEGNITHLYLKKKRIFEQQVKTVIIPIPTYRNKQTHKTNSRSKKNRGCLVQLYEAIIPI